MQEPTPLEDAFTSAFMDLRALLRTDVDLPSLHYYTEKLDFAVGRLCEALAEPEGEDLTELAHRAHRAVLELAQLLEGEDSDDRRVRDRLELARGALSSLLDELEPFVSRADRALRDVLLRGVPLEEAIRRIQEA